MSASGRRDVGAAALLALAIVLALWPLLGADAHSDDLTWLAFVRHAASPWPAFTESQLFGYFYRPSAFVHWWLAERIAGSDLRAHYALVLAVHAAGGALFALWLRRSGLAASIAWPCGALAALALPVAGTAMWLSSRNETLAIVAGLAALALAPRAAGGPASAGVLRAVGVGLLLAVACTAKETGLVFAAAVAAQAALSAWPRRPWRLPLVWAVVLPALLALLARQSIIVPIGPEAGGVELGALWRDGVVAWWRHLPAALAGWGQPSSAVRATLLAAAAVLVLAGLAAARDRGRVGLLAAAVVLAVLPAPLQSPITSLVLPAPGADAFLVNLRFFASATLGLVALAALGVERAARSPMRWPAAAMLAALIVASALGAHGQAQRWVQETQALAAPLHVARRLPVDVAAGAPPACLVAVEGTGLHAGLAPYLDSAVRALAPRGRPPTCLLAAEGVPPHVAFLAPEACRADAAWGERGLVVANLGGRHHAEPFGRLCQIALRPSPDGGPLRPDRRTLAPPAASP